MKKADVKRSKKDKSYGCLAKVIAGTATGAFIGAFLMYCSVQGQYKLDSSRVISIQNEDVHIEVSRKEMRDYLEEAERNAILDEADLRVKEEFYKDIDVSSDKWKKVIDTKYNKYIETYYDNEQTYDAYSKVYKLSKEFVMRQLTVEAKMQKYLESIAKETKINDESAEAEWELNSESYKYAKCDVVVFNDDEYLNTFLDMTKKGYPDYSKLDLNKVQISTEQELTFNDERVVADFSTSKKGDVLVSTTSDGFTCAIIVKDVTQDYDSLKSRIKNSLAELHAQEYHDSEFDKFYESLDVYVQEEKVSSENKE